MQVEDQWYLIHETNEEERLGQTRSSKAQVQRRSLFFWTLRNEGICLIEHVSPSGPLTIGREYFCMLHTLVQFAYESLHMYGRLR